jgi:class 3 adenylate cyclase
MLGEDHIAYQVVGDGPLDVLLEDPALGNVDLAWEVAAIARVFERLASFSRLFLLDHRGHGLSDPLGVTQLTSLEERAKDLIAVLDAVGSSRATVVSNGMAGLTAMFFAAAYPNRTSALVLDGCFARYTWAPDYPIGAPPDVVERGLAYLTSAPHGRTVDEGLKRQAPHASRDDPEFTAQYLRYGHAAERPAIVKAVAEMTLRGDVRAVLPTIQAPTLVLYRSGDRFAGQPQAEYLAEHIAGSRLVEVPGADNLIYAGDSDADIDEIEEFLTGVRPVAHTSRVLATVLFTDIVGSTQRLTAMGDRKWGQVLDGHDRAVRRQLERFRGHEVKTVGDSFVATFDGPGQAIQCAVAVCDALRALGIDIRAGIHTGELEVRGDDIAGVAVHLAQRVSAVALPGEVLVSRTVCDLVAGSGLKFEDRGEHELKGITGSWQLYSVRA